MKTYYAVVSVDGELRGSYVEAQDSEHAFHVAELFVRSRDRSAFDVEVKAIQFIAEA